MPPLAPFGPSTIPPGPSFCYTSPPTDVPPLWEEYGEAFKRSARAYPENLEREALLILPKS